MPWMLSELMQRRVERLRMLLEMDAVPELIANELRLIARDIDRLPADEQRQIRTAVAELDQTIA